MATWADKPFARRHWADAPSDDDVLNDLLEVALDTVVVFAPALPPEVVEAPLSYRMAQVMQAREVWNAAQRDTAGGTADSLIGPEGYAIRVRPLTAQVKQLLRPKRGRPGIG